MNATLAEPRTDRGCPCGGATPLREVFRTSTRRYVRCSDCDLVFLYPRPPRETVEAYFRENYDGDYGEVEASDDRKPVFHSVLEHLSRYRRTPGTLLDIGCGDGKFLTLCRNAGWTCSGIELSKGAAARAAKKGFALLPPQILERADHVRSFDVVTLINVLETVADPLAMLRQVSRVVNTGGLVIVRATNGAFHLPMRTPARWIGSQQDQAFHWYLYTDKAMRTLMQAAGLEVIGIRNSRPSRGPVSPAHPRLSRLKWTLSRGVLWPVSQVLYVVSGGRMVIAPSFEIVATSRGDR